MSEKITVLITGAGGGGGNNLITSIRSSKLGKDLRILGSNMDEYALAKSCADETFLLPCATEPNYVEALNRLIDKKKIDLVIPNNDREVGAISGNKDRIKIKTFLPKKETVDICQDKFRMFEILKEKNIPTAETCEIKDYEDIYKAFEKLPPSERYWVRMRRSSASRGAVPVKTPQQAKFWIEYWDKMRGYPPNIFTISEFLPGRDYAFQSVWKDGKLKVAKLCERLKYYMGENRVSGMSSTPQLARTTKDNNVLDICFRAIKAIDNSPHGNFCIDIKCKEDGTPCVTEFNIGRFCMITPIFDFTGKYNTAEIYIRCAFDMEINIDDPIDIEEDCYLIRDLDTLPTIKRGYEIKEIIERGILY
jgi:carbamoyl-phosphate synthase large subunit